MSIIEQVLFLLRGSANTANCMAQQQQEAALTASDSKVMLEYVAKLKQELTEAREDTERLDWLEKLHPWPVYHDGYWLIDRSSTDYATFREAIDAAKGAR